MRRIAYPKEIPQTIQLPSFGAMKSLSRWMLVIAALLLLDACGPKPQYKTREGKKKLKHYNSVQYQQPQP